MSPPTQQLDCAVTVMQQGNIPINFTHKQRHYLIGGVMTPPYKMA